VETTKRNRKKPPGTNMTPTQIFDLEPGESFVFGAQYGSLATMTKVGINAGRMRKRRFVVTAAPGGSMVTRLPDEVEVVKPKRIGLAQRLRDIAPGSQAFFPASQFSPLSLRTIASAINGTGERRFQVLIEQAPIPGTRVTSLDQSAPIADATGTPIDYSAGQRTRKYPFATMKPGDSFTVPTGTTDITALRGNVQYHRTRNPTLQYKITRNKDGGFTVTCAYRAGSPPVPAVVPLKTNETRDFEEW
jgi:hypothetical protein